MGLFNKILHAGEGRRLKAVQAIVPEVNALEPEIERLSDEQLAAKTAEFRQRVDRARPEAKNPEHEKEVVHEVLDDAAARGVRGRARSEPADARPAALRRADHGRRRARTSAGSRR